MFKCLCIKYIRDLSRMWMSPHMAMIYEQSNYKSQKVASYDTVEKHSASSALTHWRIFLHNRILF